MDPSDGLKKTILLVEDDEGSRYAVATFLEGEGYRVIQAIHGVDALEHGGDGFAEFDILVTDFRMPHMSGRALAETLRTRCPQLPVLFLTGEPIEVVKDGLGPSTAYIQKPCYLLVVAAKIRELLNPGTAKADAAKA